MQSHQLDMIRLMVRFKLQVRRLLDQAVDLDQLVSDLPYARTRLAEIEAACQDEDLLIMLVQLRTHLLEGGQEESKSRPKSTPRNASTTTAANEVVPAHRHKYLYGARG